MANCQLVLGGSGAGPEGGRVWAEDEEEEEVFCPLSGWMSGPVH